MHVYVITVFFIVQTVVVFGNEERAVEMEQITLDCAREHNMKEDSIMGGAQNLTYEYKCFIKCQFIKMGYVDNEGNTDIEGYKKDYAIDEEDIKAIETCSKDNTNTDLCEKVFNIQTCNIMYFDSKE